MVGWLGRISDQHGITVESANGNEVTLTAGLDGGETVVVAGPAELVEGAAAKVKTP